MAELKDGRRGRVHVRGGAPAGEDNGGAEAGLDRPTTNGATSVTGATLMESPGAAQNVSLIGWHLGHQDHVTHFMICNLTASATSLGSA